MENFKLSDTEYQKFLDWHESLPKVDPGMIGGRYTFKFTPTSVGTFIEVEDCVTKAVLMLEDGSSF